MFVALYNKAPTVPESVLNINLIALSTDIVKIIINLNIGISTFAGIIVMDYG